MAIYHLSARTGSRAGGNTAGDLAKYSLRQGQWEEKSNELIFAESGNMPAWAEHDSVKYWKSADLWERANGRLFKEIEFALPRELQQSQQIQLVKNMARELTAKEKLPYTVVIHDPGHGNPHCHLMISERINDGHDRTPETWFKRASIKGKDPSLGGARKTESLKPKAWLQITRATWTTMANKALKEAGSKERIDHRSHAERGIKRLPQIHLGRSAYRAMLKGLPDNERVKIWLENHQINQQLIATAMAVEQVHQQNVQQGAEIMRQAQLWIDDRIDSWSFTEMDDEQKTDLNRGLHSAFDGAFKDELNELQREDLHDYIDQRWEDQLLQAETEKQLAEREEELEVLAEDQRENGPRL